MGNTDWRGRRVGKKGIQDKRMRGKKSEECKRLSYEGIPQGTSSKDSKNGFREELVGR